MNTSNLNPTFANLFETLGKAMNPKEGTSEYLTETMDNALDKLKALQEPNLSSNSLKLSEMTSDNHEVYLEAIMTMVDESEAEFINQSDDNDPTQIFIQTVSSEIEVRFTREYEYITDNTGAHIIAPQNEYEDGPEEVFYNGEKVCV